MYSQLVRLRLGARKISHGAPTERWRSDGFAFMLAIGNGVYSFLGTDCGAHLCEEIPNPGKNVPKVIMYPIAMGLITAWPYAVACVASITDITAVLNTVTGLPLLEIYYQGTGSRVGATVLMALFAFCFFGCAVANGQLDMRWAFPLTHTTANSFTSRYDQFANALGRLA